MMPVQSTVAWRRLSLSACLAASLWLPSVHRVLAADAPPSSSELPEETLSGLVTQLSDSLATKIQNSSCPDMVVLLDQIKATSSKPMDPDSLITKVLNDVKGNPALKAIIIQRMGGPLLNRMLDCNMVPLELLNPS
ncbi:MAG: hypothetical protein WCD18_07945 [Thermosynechococcaceae cyanobacterium]